VPVSGWGGSWSFLLKLKARAKKRMVSRPSITQRQMKKILGVDDSLENCLSL